MPVEAGNGNNVVGNVPLPGPPPLPPPTHPYPMPTAPGGSFYYHPSNGIGQMTGGWGDPRSGGSRLHQGQDIRMPTGTPLIAVTSGTITHYQNDSAGTVIYLNGDDGNKYSYFHMDRRTAAHGTRVIGGQMIGTSGDTGNSDAPHLHFETWINGRKVDPALFLSHTRIRGQGERPPPSGGYGATEPLPGGMNFFNEEEYYGSIAEIFGNVDMSAAEDTTYGAWAQQLRDFQRELAAQGLAEPPRKIKAKNLLHSTLRGMAGMVKRDGYGDSSLPASTGSQIATQGSNVVEGQAPEASNVVTPQQGE